MAKKMQYQTVWTQGKKGSDDAFFVRANVFVIEQGFKVEFDDLDKVCWHLTVYDRNEPIGAARIYQDTDGVWQLGRICVLENYRGKKIGSLILSACEEKNPPACPRSCPCPTGCTGTGKGLLPQKRLHRNRRGIHGRILPSCRDDQTAVMQNSGTSCRSPAVFMPV